MKDEAAESLRALASTSDHRSKMGRIRLLYAEIESAKRAGVSLETMLETLNEHGLGATMSSFKSMLHRVRQELKEQERTMPAAKQPATSTPKREVSTAAEDKATPTQEKKPGEPRTFNWDTENNEKPEW